MVADQAQPAPADGLPTQRPITAKPPPQPLPLTPARTAHPELASLDRLRSSSPRLARPASTEIFERSVQEPVSIASLGGEDPAAHIPAHVVTEDLIPPALGASAQAITSSALDPDDVEIVTAAAHQPAAAVLDQSAAASQSDLASPPAFLSRAASDDLDPASSVASLSAAAAAAPSTADDETASTYGQLDPHDVRRLSFISFKDVVLSEHAHAAHADLGSPSAGSPLRAPASPVGGVTTPPSVSFSPPGETSPLRGVAFGNQVPAAAQHGELAIETMRQALRKTASGDLGASANALRHAGSLSPTR